MNLIKISKTNSWIVLFFMVAALLIFFSTSSYAQYTIQKKQMIKNPQMVVKRGDLSVIISQCPPSKHKAGADLNNSFVVEAKSTFPGAVKNVVVDIFLTSKTIFPTPVPITSYSPHYSDRVLLKGGRENISFSGPGTINVKLNGTNTIPADTPTGIYYLGVSIDAGNKVKETDEKNNVTFCGLKIIGKEMGKKPDLIIPSLQFKKVKKMKDKKGKSYWVFNVLITVKNNGNGDAGPFMVLLERNIGAGGAYFTACSTCVLEVSGLTAGQAITLPPRQFNNANNLKSSFRATADNTNMIAESNESNNRNTATFH